MSYICPDCGQIVDELPTRREFLTNQYGGKDAVNVSDRSCPKCGDVMVEATECKICEAVYKTDELHDGYCPECLPDAYDDMKSSQSLSQFFIQRQKEEIEQLKQEIAKTEHPFSVWGGETIRKSDVWR